MSVPSRGFCHSVFLLSYSARSNNRRSVTEWVAAARRAPTFMANALALDVAAERLVQLGLAKAEAGLVVVDHRLLSAGDDASTQTLTRIAQILLGQKPPAWVRTAVLENEVRSELIPTADLKSLAWLGEFRDPLLLDLKSCDADQFRDWLGGVGEKVVVEAERLRGHRVVQVSLLSDAFGYDVESRSRSRRRCIEVKTTLESARGRFFISRNEVETARCLLGEWLLVQIVLRSSALVAESINKSHVAEARCLQASQVDSLAPLDSKTGAWAESAKITPRDTDWVSWPLVVSENWECLGYRPARS